MTKLFVILFCTILFLSKSYALDSQAKQIQINCYVDFEFNQINFNGKKLDECIRKYFLKNEIISIDVFASSDSFGKRNRNKKLSDDRIMSIKKYLIKNYPKIPVSIYEPEEDKQYSSMGIVRLKMVDKNSKLGKYLLAKKNKQYDSLNYFSFLSGAGYSAANISDTKYTGYNVFLKFMFPFSHDYNWFYGVGVRYQNLSFNNNSKTINNSDINFNSFQTGLDLAYFFKTSLVDFVINPFAYFGFYNSFTRTITQSDGTAITASPSILNHISLGSSANILFKASHFYFGPGASYSTSYLQFNNYQDDNGVSYNGISNFYKSWNINFTLGCYL